MSFQFVIYLCTSFILGIFGKDLRIVGGENADIREFPYLVSIGFVNEQKNVCSGVIISNWHILSAAHCLSHFHRFKIKIIIGSKTIKVPIQDTYRATEISIHPKYTGEFVPLSMYQHDVAIITVDKCIRYNEFQNKVNLPTSDVGAVSDAIMSGWGRIAFMENAYPETLQKAKTNILSNYECVDKLPFTIYKEQMCVYRSRGVGACFGDSGGPLVYNGELVAIGSFVRPCAVGTPDIYTRIYPYLNFITSVITSSGLPICSVA